MQHPVVFAALVSMVPMHMVGGVNIVVSFKFILVYISTTSTGISVGLIVSSGIARHVICSGTVWCTSMCVCVSVCGVRH